MAPRSGPVTPLPVSWVTGLVAELRTAGEALRPGRHCPRVPMMGGLAQGGSPLSHLQPSPGVMAPSHRRA